VNLFLRDGVDVVSAMWYNEYHTIINSGLNPDELTTFFFHEHGLNFPEDGIYTLEETFKRDLHSRVLSLRLPSKAGSMLFPIPKRRWISR